MAPRRAQSAKVINRYNWSHGCLMSGGVSGIKLSGVKARSMKQTCCK